MKGENNRPSPSGPLFPLSSLPAANSRSRQLGTLLLGLPNHKEKENKQMSTTTTTTKTHKTWCASWWTRREVRLLFKKIAFLNIFHTHTQKCRQDTCEGIWREGSNSQKGVCGVSPQRGNQLESWTMFQFFPLHSFIWIREKSLRQSPWGRVHRI